MNSPVALLRACYDRLHAFSGEVSSRSFSKAQQKSWFNFLRSVTTVLNCRNSAAADRRRSTNISFDFVAGIFSVVDMSAAVMARYQTTREVQTGLPVHIRAVLAPTDP